MASPLLSDLFLALRQGLTRHKAVDDFHVIDGDSVRINGAECRLHGIDAPEYRHPYGKQARQVLVDLSRSGPLTFKPCGSEVHGRRLVTLFAAGKDLNKAMVDTGYARAYTRYSLRYALPQIKAWWTSKGIWSTGRFVHPEKLRHGKKDVGSERSIKPEKAFQKERPRPAKARSVFAPAGPAQAAAAAASRRRRQASR